MSSTATRNTQSEGREISEQLHDTPHVCFDCYLFRVLNLHFHKVAHDHGHLRQLLTCNTQTHIPRKQSEQRGVHQHTSRKHQRTATMHRVLTYVEISRTPAVPKPSRHSTLVHVWLRWLQLPIRLLVVAGWYCRVCYCCERRKVCIVCVPVNNAQHSNKSTISCSLVRKIASTVRL